MGDVGVGHKNIRIIKVWIISVSENSRRWEPERISELKNRTTDNKNKKSIFKNKHIVAVTTKRQISRFSPRKNDLFPLF